MKQIPDITQWKPVLNVKKPVKKIEIFDWIEDTINIDYLT